MTTPLDRNDAFFNERLSLIQSLRNGQADAVRRAVEYNLQIDQRIKDGRLVPLGGDRYQVIDAASWDNGEIWTYRRMSEQAPRLLLPEHGLDETEDGGVALYTKRPPWHGLGNFHLEGLTDIQDVLRESGLDFTVEQRKVRYSFGSELREVPDMFVNVRSDNGASLGVVGKIYTPVQNNQAFEFLQDLADNHSIMWETAGMTVHKRIFVSMRLPDTLVIDGGGLNDTLIPYIVAFNSHDGHSPFQVVATPWAPLCGNTERFALRDATAKWTIRHTTNAPKRVDEARRTLGLSLKYYERLTAEETALTRAAASMDDIRALLAEVWPVKKEDDGSEAKDSPARKRREAAIEMLWEKNSKRAGATGYAAERTFTEYLDHVSPRRVFGDKLLAFKATQILEGADDGKKARVHQKLMLKVK